MQHIPVKQHYNVCGKRLTCVLQAAVGEGQQRGIEGPMDVLQDGIVLVDVLHHLRVELVLLKDNGRNKSCVESSYCSPERAADLGQQGD